MDIQAKLNGVDFYEGYGVVFTNGLKNMEVPPELKEAESYDWPDEDGTDELLTSVLKDTDVSLDCALRGNDLQDAKTRKDALVSVLKEPRYKQFWVASTNETYFVKYRGISSFDFVNPTVMRFKLDLTIKRNTSGIEVIGGIYFGPMAVRPTTAAAIKTLPSDVNTLRTVTLNTGLNRIMVIALPQGLVISNAYDDTSLEELTSEYVRTTLTVDNQPYSIYTMELAKAYSENHEHIITITNG
jgi:hypothetical protein